MRAVVAEIRNLADKAGLCDVFPAAAITKDIAGEWLTDIAELAESGSGSSPTITTASSPRA